MQPGGWWEGTLPSGKSGMFPDNFVKVLEPDEMNPVVLRYVYKHYAYDRLNSNFSSFLLSPPMRRCYTLYTHTGVCYIVTLFFMNV